MEIDITPDENLWKAMVVVPLFWWAVHALHGHVRWTCVGVTVGWKCGRSFRSAALGGVLLFFALLLLDDVTQTHVDHYETLGVWMGTHMSLDFGSVVVDVEGGGTRSKWNMGLCRRLVVGDEGRQRPPF